MDIHDGRGFGLIQQAFVRNRRQWAQWMFANDWDFSSIDYNNSLVFLLQLGKQTSALQLETAIELHELVKWCTPLQWETVCQDIARGYHRDRFIVLNNQSSVCQQLTNTLNQHPAHAALFQKICGKSVLQTIKNHNLIDWLEQLHTALGWGGHWMMLQMGKGSPIIVLASMIGAGAAPKNSLLRQKFVADVFDHADIHDQLGHWLPFENSVWCAVVQTGGCEKTVAELMQIMMNTAFDPPKTLEKQQSIRDCLKKVENTYNTRVVQLLRNGLDKQIISATIGEEVNNLTSKSASRFKKL